MIPTVFFLSFGALSAVLGVLGGILGGGLDPQLSLVILSVAAVGATACAWCTRRHRHHLHHLHPVGGVRRVFQVFPPNLSWLEGLVLLTFLFAAWRSFLWLVFADGTQWFIGSPYNVGDMALHWQLINYLASGVPLWPESPIFLEGPLRYPVGINLANALWVSLGVALPQVLVWTGLLGSALTAYTLWRWAGGFGLAVLLFSGGLGGWMFFSEGGVCAATGQTDWKNLFLTVFVTQRGFLWALPAGLLLLQQWRERLENRPTSLPLVVEVLLYSLMPLFHLHTFLFLSALLGCAFLFAGAGSRRLFLLVGLTAFLPAGVLAGLVTGGFSAAGGLGWHPGWLQGDAGLEYWWWNFGLWLPVFAWLMVAFGGRLWTQRSWNGLNSPKPLDPGETPGASAKHSAGVSAQRQTGETPVSASSPLFARSAGAFLVTGLGFLVLCFFFRFAPWAWDNVKILLWVWIGLAPWVWKIVVQPLALPLRSLLLVALFGSGAVELFCGLRPHHIYGWIDRWEMAEAQSLLQGIPPSTRIAVLPDTPHAVALAGFAVAVGYPGHLWSHGYNYLETEEAVEALLSHGRDSPLLDRVEAVWIGPRERKRFGPDIWKLAPGQWIPQHSGSPASLWLRQPLAEAATEKSNGSDKMEPRVRKPMDKSVR